MAATGLPDLSTLCIQIQAGTGELCVVMPGGARICASYEVDTGDPLAIVQAFLAQVNTALTPLTPFFNILDVLQAIFDCITAIPEAIATLNPQPIISCAEKFGKALSKLLAMLPILAVPILVVSIIDAIIAGLIGLKLKLAALIAQFERIAASATRAAALGNVELQFVVDCASSALDAQLVNMNASMTPLNRMIGLLNALLESVGLPCIPTLGGIAGASQGALDALDAAIAVLQVVRAAIPTELPALPGIPPAGEC